MNEAVITIQSTPSGLVFTSHPSDAIEVIYTPAGVFFNDTRVPELDAENVFDVD